MDERQLRAFVAVVENGRMDRAAHALGYSQSAVNYQIKCLESSLRTTLFTREPGGAKPTDAGCTLLPSARAVLLLLDQIRQLPTLAREGQPPPALGLVTTAGEIPPRSR